MQFKTYICLCFELEKVMKSQLSQLFETTENLPYVGEKTFAALTRLDCKRVIDLLFHFPYDIEVWDNHLDVSTAAHKSQIVVKLQIQEIEQNHSRTGKKITRMLGFDGKNYVYLTFFNYVPYLNRLVIGSWYIVSGKIERLGGGEFQIIHPDISDVNKQLKTIQPKYPLTYAITSKQIQSLVKFSLVRVGSVTEWLPQRVLDQKGWKNWATSLELAHNPKILSDVSLNAPFRERLAFDELLASQVAIRLIRKNKASFTKGRAISINHRLRKELLAKLGFVLTEGQEQVIKEIESDQVSELRMMRLLQGDVGSGKTLVSLCVMLNVVGNGMQAAIMAPTDILATQHYNWIHRILEGSEVKVGLLTGSTKLSKRKEILEELKEGKIHILVGTHVLFQMDVEFNELQLVIIDEQHRFGVEQRLELMDKGKNCDVLVMSATPIPRTLALTAYGDMDISILHGKPKGRMPIHTSTISLKRADEIMELVKQKIDKNEQIFWVCPMIENVDEDEVKEPNLVLSTVTDRYNSICQYIDPSLVSVVHGKLSSKEKDEKMTEFALGKTKLLVATTVIEVGIDVPNATLLIIENAERFGLAQLHQLRGRVGRGSLKSDCVLLFGNRVSEIAKKRLQTMRVSDDGFYIAEQDLELRGGGDLLGAKQSGMPGFRIADLEYHRNLLLEAHQLAKDILDSDGQLHNEYANMRLLLHIFDYDKHLSFLFAG